MSRVQGRSFKITKNQAKGYGYAKPGMRKNPGVTTIAAINGRGSYAARRSARSVMSKLKQNARPAAARRALSASEKAAFKARMAKARAMRANRSTSPAQSMTSRRNIKKAQRARKAWGRKLPRGKRVRVGRAAYGRKPKTRRLKPGVYVANRRKKAGSKTMARRRKRASGLTKKRRSSKRRRKTTKKTVATKRRRSRKAKASTKRRKAKRKTTTKRRRRSSAKRKAAPRRRRKATSKRRRSSAKRKAAPRRRRKATSKRRRRSSAKRKAAPRRRKHRRNGKLKSNRRRRSGKKLASNRRRKHSRNGKLKSNRRRKHRRNGRSLFRKNGAGEYLKLGATVLAGFALHRVLSNVLANQVLPRLLPAPAAPSVSGFTLSGQKGLIASLLVGAAGGYVASKVIKNQETKKLVIGGLVVSTLHGIIMSVLKEVAPAGADMLAGPEDGTAARLSAMYGMRGLGNGASIMPRYEAINGLGEYFREPMNGLGEYFREPMNGVGEYIAATSGIGSYEGNSDLFQAAAGMGSHDYNGNHIDPSGDLERQLTIAEAAAGVGAVSPFEAAAGIGPMQAAAGFGAVNTVPSGDTWIPGTTDGQLWAGVKAISQGQSATEMTPAGMLQSDGGQGIFG